MYIVLDTLTNDAIGPFDTDHDAYIFCLEAADLVADSDISNFDIHELLEPQEWALNNLDTEDMDKILTASNTKETPKVEPISYKRGEPDVNNDSEDETVYSTVSD